MENLNYAPLIPYWKALQKRYQLAENQMNIILETVFMGILKVVKTHNRFGEIHGLKNLFFHRNTSGYKRHPVYDKIQHECKSRLVVRTKLPPDNLRVLISEILPGLLNHLFLTCARCSLIKMQRRMQLMPLPSIN